MHATSTEILFAGIHEVIQEKSLDFWNVHGIMNTLGLLQSK